MDVRGSIFEERKALPRKEYQRRVAQVSETVALRRAAQRSHGFNPVIYVDYPALLMR